MIKAVFFDFYNTVGRFWPPREELQATACGEFGIEVTPDGVDVGYSLADAYMAREGLACLSGTGTARASRTSSRSTSASSFRAPA